MEKHTGKKSLDSSPHFARQQKTSEPQILPLEVRPFGLAQSPYRNPKVSVLLAVYNQVKFFELVLASLQAQSFQDFELLICDDGSKTDAKESFFSMAKSSGLSGSHLHQADLGFRKNELLNKAILASLSDYLIFVDGDCVLHPKFIEDHIEFSSKDHVLAGRRVNLTASVANRLTPDRLRSRWLQRNYFWLGLLNSITPHNNTARGIRIQNKNWLQLFNRKSRGLLGCNFSIHKENLFKVNGFDYRYQKSGTGEDADLEYRLNQMGVKTQSLVQRAIQYHLFHPESLSYQANHQLFHEMVSKKEWVTPFGLKQIESAIENT